MVKPSKTNSFYAPQVSFKVPEIWNQGPNLLGRAKSFTRLFLCRNRAESGDQRSMETVVKCGAQNHVET